MIIIDSKNVTVPTPEETVETLTRNTNLIGIPLNYDRLLEYYSFYTLSGTRKKKRISRYIGVPENKLVSRTGFINWLLANGVKTGLLTTPKGDYSDSSDSLESAINTGLYSEELCAVMKLYNEANTEISMVNIFKKIIEENRVSVIESYDNSRIIFVNPVWSIQNTGRIGMSQPALMNVAKVCKDIQTAPKGYILKEYDSGQIEPRITQSWILRDPQLKRCTMLYNDAYYGYIHYCTGLTSEQRQSGTLDFEPIEITKHLEEKRKVFKTLGNAAMYGSTENANNDPDKDAFIKYIGGHPVRVALQADVERKIRQGQRVFYTFFGTPVDITKGPSEFKYTDKNSEAYFRHLVRCAINNRIQGTAADLMRISVRKADRLLMQKAKESFIVKYTHDSGTFCINEKELPRIEDELKEITSYQVDDWIPIYGKEEDCMKLTSSLPRLI